VHHTQHPAVIDGGPHAIAWTHHDQVNRALLDFLA
jgi:pimeloyl-ACP methyl ester carboxylesterase